MKTFLFALIAALLMVGQLFSPAYAANTTAAACGDTYTVQRGDYLSKIAKTCGVTLQSLINANPEIKDINKIYPGQVIRIKANATTPTPTPGPVASTYTVQRGDTLAKIAAKFNVTVQAILNVNPKITDPSRIYAGQVINIPAAGTGSIPATGRRITLSASTAKVGQQVEVKVYGFPANMDVDFRLGKKDAAYSVVYDGKTDSKGEVTLKVTIPSGAVKDEKWVVKVLTTGMANGVEITSPTITIVQ